MHDALGFVDVVYQGYNGLCHVALLAGVGPNVELSWHAPTTCTALTRMRSFRSPYWMFPWRESFHEASPIPAITQSRALKERSRIHDRWGSIQIDSVA